MYVSAVRLYHPALWKILFSYRVVLETLRIFENLLKMAVWFSFVGPLLIVWTRLPVTRDVKPPIWSSMADVVAPVQYRASLVSGGGQVGSNLALAGTMQEMADLQGSLVSSREQPAAIWTVFGSLLRGYFTWMGPAFIKFGQIFSMREELPPVIRRELQLLQDSLPAMNWKTVKKIIEREVDRPLEEVFEWVEETPMATASLAQVHRARLRKEQADVALKVQRPYLQGTTVLDTIFVCDIQIGLAKRIFRTMAKGFDFGCFTTSYRESLAKEIDFVLEERYQSRFRKHVMSHPLYSQAEVIANTYREYTTSKLLTMELIKDYYRLDRIMDELTPQQIWDFATTKVKGLPDDLPLHLVWLQIALQVEGLSRWGLSHGDCHLGNMYARAPQGEGDTWKIFLCDFGMMIEGGEGFRTMSVESGLSLCYYFDGAVIGRAIAKQSTKPLTEKNKDRLINDCAEVVEKYMIDVEGGAEKVWMPKIQRGTANNVVSDLTYAAALAGSSLAPDNWLMFKSFGYLVNMGAMMWTTFNPTNMWVPHCKKYLKDIIFHDLDGANITNMRERLPDMIAMLRDYDREQILRALATGGKVKPLEKIWAHEWDVREALPAAAVHDKAVGGKVAGESA
jgi:predicted unusual protein kinase regulating ubiquinone biosynthesis (AarF/ABC1/UbiB family)